MIYDKEWKPIAQAKGEAMQFIKSHKSIFIPSLIRVIMTISLVITSFLLMFSLAFDWAFKDYGAKTTNLMDYALTIAALIFCRILADFYLDRVIYEQTILPFWYYLVRGLRPFVYAFIALIGMGMSVTLIKSHILVYVWFITMIAVYVCQKVANFGLTHASLKTLNLRRAYKESRPRTFDDVMRLMTFVANFFGHDTLNFATFGLYGIWSIPYKRVTEKYILL